MTKIEAKKELEKLRQKRPTWFCPLIKDTCVKNCINFIRPFIIDNGKNNINDVNADIFEVVGFVCSNAEFIGHTSIIVCDKCGAEIFVGKGDF